MELFVSFLNSRCSVQQLHNIYAAPPPATLPGINLTGLFLWRARGGAGSGIGIKLLWSLAIISCLPGCAVDLAGLPDSSFNSSTSDSSELTHDTGKLLARYAGSSPAIVMTQRTDVETELGIVGAGRTPDDIYLQQSTPEPGNRNNELPLQVLEVSNSFTIEAVSAPVEALLFSLASDAQLQLQLHGQVEGRVTINALDQSLDEIMRSLADQAGFSWQKTQDALLVWSGQAYAMSYPIDYLNIHRRTQSSVGLATQVGTINASAGEGGSIANSSQTRVENISEHHFWDSLQADLQSIIKQAVVSDASATSDFSINREAGLLSLYAEPEIHRNLQRYLKLLHGSTQRQVLIEATVVEVALSDSFEAGVDWQVLADGISGFSAAQVLVGAPPLAADTINRIAAPAGLVSFTHQGSNGDVRATLSLLEQFGDVRILSRPRIIALNNQSSVLKVVDNRVYFTVNVQRRQTEEQDEIITETEIHTVPVGLVMNVTPYISEHGSVMLNVRPTLSRILGFVNDPNPELAAANVSNGVPEIQVREMESMLQVDSGQVAIIGGLMQETQSDNNVRLPGLGSLPGIGRLFSKNSRERRQTELLIVLRPTVLDSTTSVAYR